MNPSGETLTAHLAPGTYSPATNLEAFPLHLPPSVELLGDPCGVRFEWELDPFNPIPQTILKVDGAASPSANPRVVVRDVVFFTPHRGLQVFVKNALDAPLIELQRVKSTAYYPLVVQVNAAKSATVLIQDCDLSGIVSGLKLTTFQDAHATVFATRSRFSGSGTGAAIDLIPKNAGSHVDLSVTASVFAQSGAGLRTTLSGGGTAQTTIEHCAFFKNQLFTVPPLATIGGIVDVNPVHSTWPKHAVSNSVFFDNVFAQDMPQYEASRYTLGGNLVEQAGLPGTTVGTPLFADPEAGDFHQLAGSPTIDAGVPGFAPLSDLDGDPYTDGAPDVGPDERHPRYLYYKPASPKVGKTAQTRLHGTPDAAFGVGFALASTGTFGSFQLAGMSPQPLFTGVVPPSGVFEGSLAIPDDATLVGVTVFHQALFWEPGGQVGWSANAVENLLCQ